MAAPTGGLLGGNGWSWGAGGNPIDPAMQGGLLALAANLLQARDRKQSFSGALGGGLLDAMQTQQFLKNQQLAERRTTAQEKQTELETQAQQAKLDQAKSQREAVSAATKGLPPDKAVLAQAFPEQYGAAATKAAFPEPMDPYSQAQLDLGKQRLDLSRQELASSQANQAAQLQLERARLAQGRQAPAPDLVSVQDPNDPSQSIYVDKRTGQPFNVGGNPARPASTREAGAGFNQSKDLRTAYEKLTSDPREAVTAYRKIEGGFGADSGPGDIAGIFGFMKMLDPTSVVREGEFATAENSGGVSETIRNLYNKALSGERLTPTVRQEILATAGTQLGAYQKRFNEVGSTYTDLATKFGVDPSTVVTPLEFPSVASPQAQPGPQASAAGAAPAVDVNKILADVFGSP